MSSTGSAPTQVPPKSTYEEGLPAAPWPEEARGPWQWIRPYDADMYKHSVMANKNEEMRQERAEESKTTATQEFGSVHNSRLCGRCRQHPDNNAQCYMCQDMMCGSCALRCARCPGSFCSGLCFHTHSCSDSQESDPHGESEDATDETVAEPPPEETGKKRSAETPAEVLHLWRSSVRRRRRKGGERAGETVALTPEAQGRQWKWSKQAQEWRTEAVQPAPPREEEQQPQASLIGLAEMTGATIQKRTLQHPKPWARAKDEERKTCHDSRTANSGGGVDQSQTRF